MIWARCAGMDAVDRLAALSERLEADGDAVRFVVSLPVAAEGWPAHPTGRRELKALLDLERPVMALWVGGVLDAAALAAIQAADLPLVLCNMEDGATKALAGGWFPGRKRDVLRFVEAAFAIDARAAEALVKAGAREDRTEATGPLEDAVPVLRHSEAERYEIATGLKQRPVWLARGADVSECEMLMAAHRQAVRLAHRLLMIVTPAPGTAGAALAERFRAAGLSTGLRSDGAEADDTVQVYVADLGDEDGLWLRIAPLSYAAGSFSDKVEHDPFEAAALGSVVLHGMATERRADRFRRLTRAGASFPVQSEDKLGDAISLLLSADRAALMAKAGWEVTTSGAELSNTLVRIIQARLDGSGR